MPRYITLIFCVMALCMACNTKDAAPTAPAVRHAELIIPNGGEVYHLGDTLKLKWQYLNTDNTEFMSVFTLSLDDGRSFDIVLLPFGMTHTTALADTFWIIPDDTTYVTKTARVKVWEYNEPETLFDISDQAFEIAR
jgi:hypothetical protein